MKRHRVIRQPFPSVLKNFLEDFPCGFRGQLLLRAERDYKIKAIDWGTKHLSRDRCSVYIAENNFEDLSNEIKRLYGKTNLLASFEMIKLNDAFKDKDASKSLCICFYELVYGEGELRARFENAVKVFSRYDIAKWPIITYPLFILIPQNCMFVKPEMTKTAAANRGFDIEYSSTVNWNTYQRVLGLSKDLTERLRSTNNPDLFPKDMVDIQTFMWATFGKGWTKQSVEDGKRRWPEDNSYT